MMISARTNLLLSILFIMGCDFIQAADRALPTASSGGSYRALPQLSAWPYDANGAPTLSTVSQVAGHYALGSRIDNSIEVRDIRQGILARVSDEDLRSILPEADFSGPDHGPCALTFTSSGRLLFIGLNSSKGKDAILRLNMNNKRVDVFHQLEIEKGSGGSRNYGMTHFSGKLYVGTDHALYQFIATKNVAKTPKAEKVIQTAGNQPITGLAVDILDRCLYVSTPQALYRSKTSELSLGSAIAALNGIQSITFARTYGGAGQNGLFLLDAEGGLHLVPTPQLREGGSVRPALYTRVTPAPRDAAATACGRLLLAGASPALMADASDKRMDFEAFIRAQFQGYVDAYKSCLLGYDGKTPEGFPNGTGMEAAGRDPNDNLRMGFMGWVMLPIVASGIVNNDPETEKYIELAAKRMLGFHPDGKGGAMNLDGFYEYIYKGGTGERRDPVNGGLAITHMKFTPALVATADNYPDNPTLRRYTDYMVDRFQRHSDYTYANKRITKGGGDKGPNRGTHIWGGENFAHAALTAAVDPLAELEFEHYGMDRWQYGSTEFLQGEPIMGDQPGYIVLSRTILMGNTTEDPHWRQAGLNYYYSSISVGDDIPSPYATAFSAGHLPEAVGVGWYTATTPGRASKHGYPIHFPALMGFGQLDVTSPMVGAYLAYRDGRAVPIHTDSRIGTEPAMLFRYVVDHPEFVDPRTGPPDGYFGAMGLANTIQPGILEKMRPHWIRRGGPLVTVVDNRVQLEFNRLGKRRVFGSDDGVKWIPYGYQRSPYRFPRGIQHAQYKIENREGEFMDLSNADFEKGPLGWQPWRVGGTRAYQARVTDGTGMGQQSIRIEANSDARASGLSQLLPLTYDLPETRYVLRGVIETGQLPAGASASLRLRWDSDRDSTNGTVSTQQTEMLKASQTRREVRVEVTKPAQAPYAHVELVLENAPDSNATAVFDSVTLERLGADVTGPNGNFEKTFDNWTTSIGSIHKDSPDYGKPSPAITVVPDPKKPGNRVCRFEVPHDDVRQHVLTREIDVTDDLEGTRFIYRVDVLEADLQNAEFRIDLVRYDKNGKHLDTKDWVSAILPQNEGKELVFTNRVFKNNEGWKTKGKAKKPVRRTYKIVADPSGDHRYELKFMMRRLAPASEDPKLGVEPARVVIDNFRRDKVKLYEITDKDPPAPSPATWQQAPQAKGFMSATMVAAPVEDESGRVEYKFEETSGNPGATSSDWQFSTVYVDEGLVPGKSYSYQVRTREMRYRVESEPSAPAEVRMSSSADRSPPPRASWAKSPAPLGDTVIAMTAGAVSDPSGPVQYLFRETSGRPGASQSGWQVSPYFVDEGLRPGTSYSYTVQTRDAAGNAGPASEPFAVQTPDIEPPLPNPAGFSLKPQALSDSRVHMVATVSHDANPPVEYYFEETSGNPGGTDSGWQILAEYTDFGLRPDTEYRYRVRTRDVSGNNGEFSGDLKVRTLAFFDESPPEPDPPMWQTKPAGLSQTSVRMVAKPGKDLSPPVEYFFEEMTKEIGGDRSNWQKSPEYTDTDLRPGGTFRYRFKMRDARGNETGFSEAVSVQPLASKVMMVKFERGKFSVEYFGEEVKRNVQVSGPPEKKVLTIDKLDIDGRGGRDDRVVITVPIEGSRVELLKSGYRFDSGDELTFLPLEVEVLSGGSRRLDDVLAMKAYRKVVIQKADIYELTSRDRSFIREEAKKDTTLPELDSFRVRNTSQDSQNKLRSYLIELRFAD